MSEKNVWIMFDSITQIQSQPLSHDQVQSAIFKMKPSDLARFHIWTTGWQNWQPLSLFLDSEQKDFFKTLAAEKAAQKKQVTEVTVTKTRTKTQTKSATLIKLTDEMTKTNYKPKEKTFIGDNLTWSGAAPPSDLNFSKTKVVDYSQRASRHELKIEVLLISPKGKTFRSYSKNISLSGTMLEDNVPFDYYGNVFDVVIVNKNVDDPMNSRVQIKAKTVGQSITARIQFENITVTQKTRLTGLLNEYIEKQKANQKKSA